MFLRVSVPGPVPDQMQAIADYIGTAPEPTYGGQMQDFSAPGIAPEYRLGVTYSEDTIALAGGETATLQRPDYSANTLGYGPLHPDAMTILIQSWSKWAKSPIRNCCRMPS